MLHIVGQLLIYKFMYYMFNKLRAYNRLFATRFATGMFQVLLWPQENNQMVRGQLKCDGTRAETRFRLSRETDRVHLNRCGASVQWTAGSRGVRISGSNAGYTMFRGSVKSTGYPLHSPVHLNRPVGVSSVECWQLRCVHQR